MADIQAADANPEPDDSSAEAKATSKPKASRAAQIVKVVKDIVDETKPITDVRSRKPPTADEWEPLFSRGLVYLSVFYIWWLTSDEDGEINHDADELDEERAGLIVPPFARLFVKTSFNRRYGRDLIENSDILVAVMAMGSYVMDSRKLWNAKRERQQARASNNNIVPMRREQTKTAPAPQKPQPEPLAAKTNGSEQPTHEQPKQETDATPYARPLGWEPGSQNRSD